MAFSTRMVAHRLMLALIVVVTGVQAYLPTYFMDDWCSTTFDLGVQGIEAGRLLLRPPERGMRYLNCLVFFKAPPGKRLIFKFRGFDIQSPFDCRDDHLQIFDDTLLRLQLTDQMCNTGLVPSGMYTTTGQDAAIKLRKENYLADQIELIFTAFHLAPCRAGEFQCDNSNCIHEDLYCNDYDNCGDESDQCLLHPGAIAGVVIAVVVLIIIIAAIVAFITYRRRRRLEKEVKDGMRNGSIKSGTLVNGPNGPVLVMETPYSEAWDKKSVISEAGSTVSSRLSISKKDNSEMKEIKDGNSRVNTLEGKKSRSSSSKSKKSGSSRKDNKHHLFGLDGPLKSSTLKKNKNGSGFDIYAVPTKPGLLKRQTSSIKYANDPRFLHPDSAKKTQEQFWQEPFGRSASFREGMKHDGDSRFPVHTLDVSRLAQDHDTTHGPDVYDHVISFRAYPSASLARRGRVVSLDQLHPGYHRLHHHDMDGDRASVHSSRSNLVKL